MAKAIPVFESATCTAFDGVVHAMEDVLPCGVVVVMAAVVVTVDGGVSAQLSAFMLLEDGIPVASRLQLYAELPTVTITTNEHPFSAAQRLKQLHWNKARVVPLWGLDISTVVY